MENLLELAWSALKSAITPTVLLLVIGWLCRTWIGEKLKASVKHEYDDRLEQLKAELRAQGDSNLAVLKSEIDRQADKLNRPGFFRHLANSLRNAFQTLPVTADC